MRNVSMQSPFDKRNSPPPGYSVPDGRVPLNPTKIDMDPATTKDVPMAGFISPLGEKLFMKGSKKGMHITTMDWGVGYVDNSKS